MHVVLVRGAPAHAEPPGQAPPSLVVGRGGRRRRRRSTTAPPSLAQLTSAAQRVAQLTAAPERNKTIFTYRAEKDVRIRYPKKMRK